MTVKWKLKKSWQATFNMDNMENKYGEPTGYPQLKEAKGFEILSSLSNSRDLTVGKTAWSYYKSAACQ